MNNLVTAQNITNDFTSLGTYIGLCTGPPTEAGDTTIQNECSGGSPAYARVNTTWAAGTAGTATGSTVIINVPAGTYPYVILCSAATGTDTLVDWAILATPIEAGTQDVVQLTPSVVFA